MSMRAITRVVRGASCVIVAGALVAGVGATSANADPIAPPTEVVDSTSATSETTTVRLKVGSRNPDRVQTEAARPKGLLEHAGVQVDRNDEVDVLRNGRAVRSHERRALRDGDLVKVIRVWHNVHVRTVRFDRPTRTRAVTSLAPGVRRVADTGRDGIREIRVRAEVRNGRVVDRDVHKRWDRRPQPRVVLVGTRQRTVAGTGHLNWGALARCESGGNPRAVNPAGYYGLYQFSVPTWRGVGGSGLPHQASSGEQTYRAQRLYAAQGRSPWPHCGRYL